MATCTRVLKYPLERPSTLVQFSYLDTYFPFINLKTFPLASVPFEISFLKRITTRIEYCGFTYFVGTNFRDLGKTYMFVEI